jgi:hypothetical protein
MLHSHLILESRDTTFKKEKEGNLGYMLPSPKCTVFIYLLNENRTMDNVQKL